MGALLFYNGSIKCNRIALFMFNPAYLHYNKI